MAAHQAPPSLGFSRQEHWSGLPFLSPMHEREKWKWSRSVVSESLLPYGLRPTRLLRPWDSPGKSTGVGCHCLLQSHHIPDLNRMCFRLQSLERAPEMKGSPQSWRLLRNSTPRKEPRVTAATIATTCGVAAVSHIIYHLFYIHCAC